MPVPKSKQKAKAPVPAPKAAPAERPVIYPEFEVKQMFGPKAMSHKEAGEYLGWTEDPQGQLPADQIHAEVSEVYGTRVALHNDSLNRPFRKANCLKLVQEILNKRWAGPNGTGKTPNGDTMKIGKTGMTLDMQHRGVALKVAFKEWSTGPKAAHWREVWPPDKYPNGPVIDTLVARGVDESDDTFQTINTGMAASLVDVLYRHELLARFPRKDRVPIARVLDYAVRTLWDRTGAKDNPFSPRRTHAEAVDFINRHPRLLECAEAVVAEDKGSEKRVGAWCPVGTVAGLLYLMGSSKSDPDAYYGTGPGGERTEAALNWDRWTKARQFLVALAQPAKAGGTLQMVRDAVRTAETDGCGGTRDERAAVLVRAWHQYAAGEKLTEHAVFLGPDCYHEDDDDDPEVKRFIASPTVGGIDKPRKPEDESADTDSADDDAEPGDDDEVDDEVDEPTDPEATPVEQPKAKKLATKPEESKAVPLNKGQKELLADLELANPGRLLVFPPVTPAGRYALYNDAARAAAKALSNTPKKMGDGTPVFNISPAEIDAALAAIADAGHAPALCRPGENGAVTVEEWVRPAPNGKKGAGKGKAGKPYGRTG